jgi:hypothetical protein
MVIQPGDTRGMARIPTIVMLTTLAIALPATAQSPQKPPDSRDLPVVVALDAKDCRRLLARQGSVVQHQAAPGVTYQPGRDIDSQGRPIAPADLPGAAPPLLDGPIELPIRLPLDALSGLPSQIPSGMAEQSRLAIAKVSIDPMTGKLAFNGRPLDPPAEDAIAVACREYLARPQPRR